MASTKVHKSTSGAYQHSGLGNVTRLRLLLRYRLHVISVCGHGRICRRGVDGHYLDALVLEELQKQAEQFWRALSSHCVRPRTVFAVFHVILA